MFDLHTAPTERDTIFWMGKLMLVYQLVRKIHETYPARIFTEEFKLEAIKLIAQQGLTLDCEKVISALH